MVYHMKLPCSADSPWCDSPAGGAPEMARNVLQIEGCAQKRSYKSIPLMIDGQKFIVNSSSVY